MKTMMRTAAAAGAMAVLLAACGDSPTGSATGAGAAGPSYDGGFGMGSGNREAPADTTTDQSRTTNADSTGRGGYTMGSGN